VTKSTHSAVESRVLSPEVNPRGPRFHAMDSLRAVAMLLGIVIHALQAYATMCFQPGSGRPGGIWLAEFIHVWRMPLFFLISGFFCRMMFHRYGPALYLKRRGQRIGIPLLLGLVTVSPLFVFTQEQVSRLQAQPSALPGDRGAGSPQASRNLPSPREIAQQFDANQDGQIDATERAAIEHFFQERFGFVPEPPREAMAAGGEERRSMDQASPRSAGHISQDEARRAEPPWVFQRFGDFIRQFRWFALHYLWFLWYLVLFVLIGPVVAWIAGGVAGTRPGRIAERFGARALTAGFAGLLLAVGTLPLLWAQGGWSLQTSMALLLPFPLFALQPDLPIVGFYLVYFVSGWFLHRHVEALQALARHWLPLVAIGLAVYVASQLAAGDQPPGPQPSAVGADPAQRLRVLSLYSAAAALLTFGLVGGFQALFNRPSAGWRYASDATFWLYLAHQPLVLVLQAALAYVPGPWFVQVPVVVALSTALLLVVYHYGVRHTLIGRILNGPRDRSPSTAG